MDATFFKTATISKLAAPMILLNGGISFFLITDICVISLYQGLMVKEDILDVSPGNSSILGFALVGKSQVDFLIQNGCFF